MRKNFYFPWNDTLFNYFFAQFTHIIYFWKSYIYSRFKVCFDITTYRKDNYAAKQRTAYGHARSHREWSQRHKIIG